jgi:hypothetical protein
MPWPSPTGPNCDVISVPISGLADAQYQPTPNVSLRLLRTGAEPPKPKLKKASIGLVFGSAMPARPNGPQPRVSSAGSPNKN